MTSAIRAQREAEDGFTLIELLVVVIIIGILAAIAIPAFLNQRERAWQAELTSAVRNASLEVEAEATQLGGAYPDDTAGQGVIDTFLATNVNTSTGVPISVFIYDATGTTGFRVCGEHANITTAHSVEYQGGDLGNGMQPFVEGTACAAAT